MSLMNKFDHRDCGCIVRGDGQWLRFCRQHAVIHTGILFARKPGHLSNGAEKKHRGHGHTVKTHGSGPCRLANHHAREKEMGNMKEKAKR